MPQNEQRTLEINARLRDQFSRRFRSMGRAFGRVIRTNFVAALRVLRGALRIVTGLLGAMAAAALALFAIIRSTQGIGSILDTADATSKLARSVQTTTEDLSALRVAFAFSGIEGEKFRITMQGLSRSISQALRTRGGPAFESFAELGITLEQLRNEDFATIFERIAGGLEQYNTQAEKAAVLQGLFPDQFQRLLPLLSEGAQSFRDLTEEARKYGAELDTGLGRAAEAINDDLLRLNTTMRDIARTAVIEALAGLRPFFRDLVELLADNRQVIIDGLRALIELLAQFVVWLAKAAVQLAAFLSQGWRPFATSVSDFLHGLGNRFLPLGEMFDSLLGFTPLAPELREMQATIDDLALAAESLRKIQREEPNEFGEDQARRLAKINAELETMAANYLLIRQRHIANATGAPQPLGDRRSVGDMVDDATRRARLQLLAEQLQNIGDRLRGALGKGSEGAKELDQAIDSVNRNIDELGTTSDTAWDRFLSGAREAVLRMGDFKSQVEEAGAKLTRRLISGFGDAFADFITGAKSAKQAFQDFAKGMLRSLARIIGELIIVRALRSVALLQEGGIVQGSMGKPLPIKQYQHGGIADSPQLAVFGEGPGAEAFVPLQHGRIPVRIDTPSLGTFVFSPTVQAMDARSVKELFVEQRHTIRDIWLNELQSRSGMRDQVRSA